MALLQIQGIEKRFGGLRAVDGASMDVHQGELLGLIGPNGSGKTTLLNVLSGHLPADAGSVSLDGKNVLGLNPTQLTRLGVLRMFQMTRVFNRMTAFDNLVVCGLALGLHEAQAYERAEQLLDELKLSHVMYLDAGQLSGGQRKLLEFGACFMVPPRVALLDEPFAAVHPIMKETMSEFIRRRNAAGQTFVLVSHDMPVVVDLCPRSVCMNAGKVLAEGNTQDVLQSPAVIEAYLGEESEERDHV
ncbi:ABC transporter ATP-binding protein [Parapusillimonas granuli]|uniref:ABC transporter ATP-binding protein n=1 Tax=Parapusillimonas granuli TaxID=380911 RepID=A0A853G0L0_9BURK|nr:ABC transporter ATP-binding protein [Parapusillimonas granuli]MBB5215914.1 branched-chain amino acid transport system ATP-binding protein [Parapusillimonas granuli]MEB2399395.1 ABC transporter ATP-binding protein [Alcaligenaceae bacterium]NYT50788.1 ABC transporter ATP-binding protein [Parapusillimonas granuli]